MSRIGGDMNPQIYGDQPHNIYFAIPSTFLSGLQQFKLISGNATFLWRHMEQRSQLVFNEFDGYHVRCNASASQRPKQVMRKCAFLQPHLSLITSSRPTTIFHSPLLLLRNSNLLTPSAYAPRDDGFSLIRK